MSQEHNPRQQLDARFEIQFPEGPVIRAALRQPVDKFSITALFGPSGCGKTTVLRCLAGLSRPGQGYIRCGGETWHDAEQGIWVSPQRRKIGFLFQDYALFPHRTVGQNIGYGLRARTAADRHSVVSDLIQKFRLEGLQDRYPHQISGGQQQRVALARGLAIRPRLLLLDEPLSALDETLRRELRGTLRQMLSDFAIPVVLVTHDRFEAMALADQIIVMEAGRVLQTGSVDDVFRRPADPAVARIVGTETIAAGQVVSTESGWASLDIGSVRLLAVAPDTPSRHVHVCIKGEDVNLWREPRDDPRVLNQLPARIRSITPEGPLMRIGLDCGFDLTALVSRSTCEELKLRESEIVTAGINASSIHLISRT